MNLEDLEAKIQNPVCIKIGKENVILADENRIEEHPLVPGAMFSGEHYGFIIISDYNGKQTEYSYPTQCRIAAIDLKGKVLRVFEDEKELPWVFTYDAKLKEQASCDQYIKEACKYIEDIYCGEEDICTLQKKK